MTQEHKIVGYCLFQERNLFLGKPDDELRFAPVSEKKLNSEETLRHLNNRASFTVLALQILSGFTFGEVVDSREIDSELELLLSEIMKKRKACSKKQQN